MKQTTLAPKIRDWRKEKQLTQEELADQLGVSRQTVFLLEHGRCDPSLSLALKIAEAFDATIEDMFLMPDEIVNHQPTDQSTFTKVTNFSKGGVMYELTPWSPLRELRDLRSEIDRLFDESFTFLPRLTGGVSVTAPAINLKETDIGYELSAAVPGFNEEEIDVEVGENHIALKGEKKHEAEEKKKGYHRVEFGYGSFERTISLPNKLNPNKVEANLKDGTLHVSVQKETPTKPKVTKVKVSKK